MAILSNGSVRTGDCIVLWDGITRPEVIEATADKPAGLKYTLKLAFPADSQTAAELRQESDSFTKSKYPTGTPRGFEPALRNADVSELPGHLVINSATYNTAPEVFDSQGRSLSPAEYARLFYAGCKVQAVLTPRVYDAKGNRGAGFWLGGVLIVDSNAPKLSIAAGMSSGELRNAFGLPDSPLGGAAAPVPPAQAAAPAAPPAAPATPSAPQPPEPACSAPSAPTSPSNPVAVAPNYGMLQPPPAPPAAPAAPVKVMTPAAQAAGYTYDALKSAGWSDEQMIQAGYLVPM